MTSDGDGASAASASANTTGTTGAPPRTVDAPRRCFICLTDEDPSDPPASWVDPCPCTLEAHQDCMLSWVTDCERSNKPLICPVCKSRINLEGPWDPIVALTDDLSNKFTRASPLFLLSSVTIGIQTSLQMYGAMALWAFAGRDAMLDFLFGAEPGMGAAPGTMAMAGPQLGHAFVLTNVGPALLVGQLTPWLGNKIFLFCASLHGVYHIMHDPLFLTWPPSPQLAMTVFPYIRSGYLNFWREFVYPYEVSLNRRILGLPPLEPRQNEGPVNNARRDGQGNGGGNGNGNANVNGGFLGLLNGLLDALDPDDEEDGEPRDNNAGGQLRIGHEEHEGDDGEMMVELVIEEVVEEDEDDDDEEIPDLLDRAGQGEDDREAPLAGEAEEAEAELEAEARPVDDNGPLGDNEAQPEPNHVPDHQHEAPQAPPARRPGLGSILSGVSSAIVSALILPGISFAMGELLRAVLPASWTTTPRLRWFGSAGMVRPGLLQQQWGRSLVGGCLYVVLKDVLRVYSKYRKVASMGKRRVKNVERRRGRR